MFERDAVAKYFNLDDVFTVINGNEAAGYTDKEGYFASDLGALLDMVRGGARHTLVGVLTYDLPRRFVFRNEENTFIYSELFLPADKVKSFEKAGG